MEGDTESLRKTAPHWSLDGDKQLLGVLQKIHQKIMTKCEQANVKLDAMVDALDNASIDLQNVNNKFMALSNNQFVESRVYDDDIYVSTAVNIPKAEPPIVEAESEIMKLKRSLQILEQMHEPVHILDSDSSDDEDDGRIILKPKDIYSRRPLPYVIGTQAWKSKWHAGLLQEESDSDSSVSKHDNMPADEYSESEPETVQTDKLDNRTISSSSMESEVTSQPPATTQVTRQPTKPADIAAELARRLGGQPAQLVASEPVEIQTPPEQISKKVYRVEKPAPTTVFSDEPPPLDDYQSYKSDYTDDDDIFAELHKKPNPMTKTDQSRVAKDSFGGLSDNIVDDLFGEVESRDYDIGNVLDYQDIKPSPSGRQKHSVLDDRQQPKSVVDKPVPKPRSIETKEETEGAVKKPVGGISLFGTNKGAESIGAAILKRNQRKSSTSDEDSNAIENKVKLPNDLKKEEPVNKVIKELFSKPAKKVTKKKETIVREEPETIKPTKDKIDLFSDNLFDDIDDIFNTNVVTKPKDNKPQKSIFDDDDLFADITINKPEKHEVKTDTQSIYDKDNDLFDHNKKPKTNVIIASKPINVDKEYVMAEENVKVNTESSKKPKGNESKGLHDDDSEVDLFAEVKMVSEVSTIENVKKAKINNNYTTPSTEKVNSEVNQSLSKSLLNSVSSKSQLESPSIFDDLFSRALNSETINEQNNVKNIIKNVADKTKDKHVIIRQNKSEYEVVESCDSNEAKYVEPAETYSTYIPPQIRESQISQPQENLAKDVINDILEQKQNTTPTHLTSVDDMSKKSEPDHFETSYETVNYTPPLDVMPEIVTTESNEPGLLSDIFIDMPPAFEKPLEPKKSKNVNALFDDDSDDETLFFKKNEAISDVKPDLNFNSERFRIFHDEPPEIDVIFSQEPLKNIPSFLNEHPDDRLFESLSKLQDQDKEIVKFSVTEENECRQNNDPSKENKVTNVVSITRLIQDSAESDKEPEINVSKLLDSFEENTSTVSTEDISDKPEVSETETFVNRELIEDAEPIKSIGKLNHVNFNINVNTLLPGASLKSKINEEIDGQTISTKSNEGLNIHSSEKTETKIVKSVSFDGDLESEVLDNKLSKQRAKIQVKRRPSSRRARLEAVRKSRIDLASDSTDNSSSFDDPPYKEMVNRERFEDKDDSSSTQQKSTSSNIVKQKTSTVDSPTHPRSPVNVSPLPDIVQKTTDILIDTKKSQLDIKSKVVYILNDEDIFNDMKLKKEDNTEKNKVQDTSNLDVVQDDDDFLFKTPNISTLGKTYEHKSVSSLDYLKTEPTINVLKESDKKNSGIVKNKLPKTKKSLFGDLSDDDELFKNKNPVVQKLNTFDSEGDIFVKSNRESKSTVDVKKETMKGFTFGDGSDDDSDLFGVNPAGKTTGNVIQNIPKPKEVAAKTSEPVFEDPLSRFNDDS